MADEETVTPALENFTCERCGYEYQKQKDYRPFLCHRCLRYIGKKVFTLMNQITPPVSRTERAEI